MPYGDRRGPRGEGPRTGRGLGYCSGFNSPGYTKGTPRGGAGYGGFGRGAGYGRGFGRGYGFGRGFARRVPRGYPGAANFDRAPASEGEARQSEKAYLSNEIEVLEEELEAMKSRMRELDREGDE